MKTYKSFLSLLLIGIVYLVSIWCYKPYRDLYGANGIGDPLGYYIYLPAFFLHHDAADLHTTMSAKYSHSSPGKKAEGVIVNKYFMGTAVLQAPFFAVAHMLAGAVHQPADGFSMIYMYAVTLSCFFYAMAGLFLLSVILRRYFSNSVIAIVLLIIGLATNLYFLVTAQPPFCHAYLFFWYALLIWVTIRYYETQRGLLILLIGFISGMIILTRPNEMYAVLIPVLWGLDSRRSVIDRIRLFRSNIAYVAGAAMIMIACIIPQLIWWKVSTGHYFSDGYTDEKFHFLHPRIWDGLTSFQNGWLIYCPIMILSLTGIWRMVRTKHAASTAVIGFTMVHVYVIYSWWCWFYMGSYGSRPMTEAYPLLCIPLAFTVEWMLRSWPRRVALSMMIAVCIAILLSQTYQTSIDIFKSEISNWRFNLITLGKLNLSYEEAIVMDTKEFQPHDPVYIKTLADDSLEDPSGPGSDTTVAVSGRRSLCVRKDSTCLLYTGTLRASGAKRGQWIKASVNCLAKEATDNNWYISPLVIMCTLRSHSTAQWRSVGLQNRINNPMQHLWHYPVNEWGRVYFYSQVPHDMGDDDEIKVYVEHRYGPDIYIDDAKIEVYEEKQR
ncbi:MAG: hypothetical protein JWO03_2688 [Bacteroidetes bacterium]|nr:hypothetical protein [Bacteroidota bacterium]